MTKSIEQQTGWKRPFSKMLLQDDEILSKINSFSFDKNDEEFIKYFIKRTGIVVCYNLTQDRGLDFSTFNPGKIDNLFENKSIKWVQLLLARLEDCWEIYQENKILQPKLKLKLKPKLKLRYK